jgi:signal transduction histidine kinase
MHKTLFVVFTLLATQLTFSQANYQIDWFSADNNYLPQNSVKSIVKDKYGFIWLSTEDGLVRYDGTEFKVISNISGITSSRMIFFWGQVEKDSIFIKNDKNEVILIHGRRAVKYNKETVQPYPARIPYRYEQPEGVYGTHHSKENEFFKIVASNGYFIIGNDSIRHFNSQKKCISTIGYNYPLGSQFFAVGPNLYLMQENGYVEFSGGHFEKKVFKKPFRSRTSVFTNPIQKQAFIYSGRTLYLMKLKDGNLTPEVILEDHDIITQNIISIYYSPDKKIVYLGSFQEGLGVIKPNKFNTATSKLSDNVYYATAKFTDTSIITSTGEIFDSNGYSGSINIRNTDKHMMAIDDRDNLWIKEHYTLYCYYKDTNFKEYKSWKLQGRINAIAKGPDGRIWICTQTDLKNGQISIIDTEKNTAPVHFLDVPFHANCIEFLNSSTMLAGSQKGLHIINLGTKGINNIKVLSDSFVRSIQVKHGNEIWITTYNNGFFLYRDNKVIRFPLDKNKYLLSSHYIIEDNNGFFWIPTNKGLFQVRKQELYNFAKNPSNSVYYHYYDKSEGFISNEFNGGCQPCGTFLNKETIFLPSIKGIVYFNPDTIEPDLPSSEIYIDEADVDGSLIRVTDNIVLDRDFHRIKFYISSPYFGNANNQNIEFMLDGPVHQHWMQVTDNNIIFSTLPPGNYKLSVRKKAGFGLGYKYYTIKIVVPAPFWQTGWFFVSMVFLLIAVIILITHFRTRYMKYKNALLEKRIVLQTAQLHDTISALRQTKDDLDKQVTIHKKLVKTITHDIKSPLRFITLTGRYVYGNSENTPAKDSIEAIYTSAQQLYNFVDNYLENAKNDDINTISEPYSLYALTEEKIAFFNTIAKAKKITLFNSISKEMKVTVNRHLLSIILHNLLDNSIKYTDEGSVVCSALMKQNELHIILKDTGKGMSNEQIEYYTGLLKKNIADSDAGITGMGLPIVIDLLLILGGDMQIHSSGITGTRITLIIPVPKLHGIA